MTTDDIRDDFAENDAFVLSGGARLVSLPIAAQTIDRGASH